MVDTQLRRSILGAAQQLLNPRSTFGQLRAAVHEMYGRLAAAIQLDRFDAAETHTPSGVALSPSDAAECLLDYWRTVTFLRGVAAAVGSAHKRFSQGMHVLYAGTGPFAPLLLPLLLVQQFPALEVTFVDLHQASCDALRALLERLGFRSGRYRVVSADAATYTPVTPIHLLIVETMNQALRREPQAAITRNLVRYLLPAGVLIPEAVTISLAVSGERREPFGTTPLLSLIRLDRSATDPLSWSKTIVLPKLDVTQDFSLTTHVRVFGELVLEGNDSAITLPQAMSSLRALAGEPVNVRYASNPVPHLAFTAP